MWNNSTTQERRQLYLDYKLLNPSMSYSDMMKDYNSIQLYEDGKPSVDNISVLKSDNTNVLRDIFPLKIPYLPKMIGDLVALPSIVPIYNYSK